MKQETIEKVKWHYNHAREKHPNFVDGYGLNEAGWVRNQLKFWRNALACEVNMGKITLSSVLKYEVAEFEDALVHGDYQNAIEEGYDIIAVVLRGIERIKKLEVVNNQFRDTTKKEEVVVAKMETTTPTCKESLVVGNKAALRVALINVQTLIKVLSQCHANDLPTAVKSILGDMAFRISEALSASPRNCDIMSLDDARKVWFASEILPRLDGDLPLGKEKPFDEWFVSQLEQEAKGEQK
jgi:hypothetical protein